MRAQAFLILAIAAGPANAWAQEAQQRPQASASTPSAAETLTIPRSPEWLGTVRIPVAVLADGEPLPAGRYRVRLTGESADDTAAGQLAALERWVEFVQGGEVKGRALAPVVPSRSAEQVVEGSVPTRGRFRVERLKEDEYLRLWYNHRGDHILIHLPIQKRERAERR